MAAAPPTVDRNAKITFGLMGTLLATAIAGGVQFGRFSSSLATVVETLGEVRAGVERINERQQVTTVDIVEIRAEQKALRAELEALKARIPR